MCEIRELDDSYFSQIETMFRDVFNSPPWNDGRKINSARTLIFLI